VRPEGCDSHRARPGVGRQDRGDLHDGGGRARPAGEELSRDPVGQLGRGRVGHGENRGIHARRRPQGLLDHPDAGPREAPGRPALYATTKTFLDDLGLRSLSELPPLADLDHATQIELTDARQPYTPTFEAALDNETVSGGGAGADAGADAEAEAEAEAHADRPDIAGDPDAAPPSGASIH